MMSRTALTVCVGVCICALNAGCANFFEARAIAKFESALEDKKLDSLKNQTSADFQQKALRHAEALDDFEILRIPNGKTSIVSVKEGDSKNEKRVKVEVGENKQKLLYRLVKNQKTGQWVVDDIYVRQKKRGLETVRSVTEQMDLLLTVREFLETWDGGKRERVLAITAPELQSVLRELPEPFLKRLTKQVIGKRSKTRKLRPKAELDGDDAIVTLPRTSGKMILTFKLIDEKWKVSDLAVEAKLRGRDKNSAIPSVLKTATALQASLRFLAAYKSADKRTLETLCTRQLWNESLKFTTRDELAAVRLTPSGVAEIDYKMHMRAHRGNFILEGRDEWLQISLIKNEEKQTAGTPTEYVVEDVTIHHTRDQQKVRLSSFFMSKRILGAYSRALSGYQRDVLRHISTLEFNRRVWEPADVEFLRKALPRELVQHPPQVIDTKFHGPVTRIEARHGHRRVTYVMRDNAGRVRVDDILIPQRNLPESLRERLELQLPIYRFAQALRNKDIPALQRTSSSDFNRLTWKMARTIPPAGALAPKYLDHPLAKVEKHGTKTIVLLGSLQFGSKVLLTTEHNKPVIDDVLMVAGPEPRQSAKLKQLLREQLAGGPVSTPIIQQAQHTRPSPAANHTDAAARTKPLNLTASFRPDDSAFQELPAAPSRRPLPRQPVRKGAPTPAGTKPDPATSYLSEDMIDRTPVPAQPPKAASTYSKATPPVSASPVSIPKVHDNPFAEEIPHPPAGPQARRDSRGNRFQP